MPSTTTMLAKLKSGFSRSSGVGGGGGAGAAAASGREGLGPTTASDGEDERESFEEPLSPHYMFLSQQEKQQVLRTVSSDLTRTSPGRSPVLRNKRLGVDGESSGTRVKKHSSPGPQPHSQSVDTTLLVCPIESNLDSPLMSRAKTLPVTSAGNGGRGPSFQQQLQPSHASQALPHSTSFNSGLRCESPAVVGNDGAAAAGSVNAVDFKKRQKEMKTLPTIAPTEGPILASRGGVEDDYMDPFDAKLRGGLRPTSAGAYPSPGSSPSSTAAASKRTEPSDTYEDPFDAKQRKAANGFASRREPTDMYEEPFDRKGNPRLRESFGRHAPHAVAKPPSPDDVYDQPLDAQTSPPALLPAVMADEGNYMDPFDSKGKKRPKSSPLPNRKLKPGRPVDISKLPPTTSADDSNYSEPFDARKNGALGVGVYPATSPSLQGKNSRNPSNSSSTSHVSVSPQPDRAGLARIMSVPAVHIDGERIQRGNQHHPDHGVGSIDEAPGSDRSEPHGSAHRPLTTTSGGTSPARQRSPSSERTSQDNSLPGSTNISRSNSARSVRDVEIPEVTVSSALDDQPWYHGALRRDGAEKRLAGADDGFFIVRQSESCLTDYSLSLRNHNETMHLKIHRRSKDSRFVLGLHSMPFRSIPEMMNHYLKHNLPIRGAEHISLMHGVPRDSPVYSNVEDLRNGGD